MTGHAHARGYRDLLYFRFEGRAVVSCLLQGSPMNKQAIAVGVMALMFLHASLQAQEAEQKPVFAYATYFVCSPDGESRADEIIRTSFKPNYDAAVEHGDILSWTWMQHYVGGNWRRALVIVAADMNMLLDASGALGEIIQDSTPEAGRAFSAICSSHEDYIWQTSSDVGGTAVTEQRGAAGYSLYLKCDMARESRVDELVRDVFAPVYERHLGAAGLTSWNWLERDVGGDYRRLLIFGAPDHKTLMRKRAEINAELGQRRTERALREFNSICPTNEEYLWDILIQTP